MRRIKRWSVCILLLAAVIAGQWHAGDKVGDFVQKESENRFPASEAVTEAAEEVSSAKLKISDLPAYSGKPYIEVNHNQPFFDETDFPEKGYEYYSKLDALGRCGEATAYITKANRPTQPREAIGQIKPSGWHTIKYDSIPDRYLYNRCHLIAYQLTGENDNERNLITGTRYMNVEGMLAFENLVADYMDATNEAVLYRVTPCFLGKNLVASGVLMEALSENKAISFCVYCYNVQPGIRIDYADGSSREEAGAAEVMPDTAESEEENVKQESGQYAQNEELDNKTLGIQIPEGTTYVLNNGTGKFHLPQCESVGDMKPKNTEYFDGAREEVIQKGYSPCGQCRP